MKEIISSYPNKHYKSKHERFKHDGPVCACKCDCDWLLEFSEPPQKKGDICGLCKEGEHADPVYKKEIKTK